VWFYQIVLSVELILIGLLLGVIGTAKRRDTRIEIDVDETDFR
jgi:hypothetical protein